jgi:hypothetical protein
MLRELSFDQLSEWMAYAELEPFDETREDLRAGSIAAAVWESTRWSVSDKDHPYKPRQMSDYVLRFGDAGGHRPRTQTWQEQKKIAELWVRAFTQEAK